MTLLRIAPFARAATLLCHGCAVGNRHAYHTTVAPLQASGSHTIAVATHDEREYVRSGNKQPDFVGLQRGGYGNPFKVTTESGHALAQDVTDSITASATGYVPSTGGVTVVPSQVDVQDIGTSHLTTEPPYLVATYVRMRPPPQYTQNARDTVRFTIVSTDSSVMQIDSAETVSPTLGSGTSFVPPNLYYGYFRVTFVGSGTARIIVSSPAFGADTTAPVTVSGPVLHLAYQNITVGTGQVFTNQYVSVDNPVTGSPLVVTLAESDSTQPPAGQAFVLSATSVTIPVGQTSSPYFNITGQTIAGAQIIARAAGYGQATTTVQVGQSQLVAPGTQTLYVGEVPRNVTVYTADQSNTSRIVAAPLVVGQTTSDPAVAVADAVSQTIPTGQYFTTFNFRGLKAGSVAATFTAPGYKADTMIVSVDTGQLSFGSVPAAIGPGQTAQMYVTLSFTNDTAITVNLGSSDIGLLTVPATVSIPARTGYAYFNVTGVSTGTATVTAIASGYARPASPAAITVGTPRLQLFFAVNTVVGQKSTLTVYTEDPLGNSRNVATPLTVTLTSSDPTHTTYDSSAITILPSTYYASTGITFTQAGDYTITGAAPGYVGANTTSSATGALVTIADFSFTPTPVTIAAGQYVTWKNTGPSGHTTTSDTPNWNSGTLGVGQTYSMYFGTAGTYTYHCNIHPAMTGTVTVTP